MRRYLLALAFLINTLNVYGDCTGKLSASPTTNLLAATFEDANAPKLKAGDDASLAIGETVLDTTVATVAPLVGTTIIEFNVRAPKVKADISTNEAKLTWTENGKEKTADLCLVGQFNSSNETIHVGPASESGGDDGTGTKGSEASAVRLQYAHSFRQFNEVDPDPKKVPSQRRDMKEFSISIDTTNEKDPKFVDDNRLHGGYFSRRYTYKQLLNRVRFGVVGEHARAFHGGNNNSDGTLSLDGWLPFFRAANILTPARRLALPLSFQISGGYRWQDVDNVNSDGPMANWTFLYHIYLLADYRIDLEHKTLFNDVKNRPASTPRTQHTWKATLHMFESEGSRFSAVASYENGHSGPVFTQLRQYFVGVGIKNLLSRVSAEP